MGARSSSPRPRHLKPLRVILLLALIVAIKALLPRSGPPDHPSSPPSANQAEVRRPTTHFVSLQGCTLASHPSNDGDSFSVHIPSSSPATFRLYFVDCPESAFRTYRSGDTNHERIRQQASHFGITPEQAVTIGQTAKKRTLALLAAGPFTVTTRWDDPFNDQRYHAFITLHNGQELIETLVREGLVRIHTKGSDHPNGTSTDSYRRQLRQLEVDARQNRRGAWSFAPSPS